MKISVLPYENNTPIYFIIIMFIVLAAIEIIYKKYIKKDKNNDR